MNKIAYTTIFMLALLFLAEAQVAMVLANPSWPFPDSGYPDWGYPEITMTSPVQNGTYIQNDVWLNLTVTKPSNWTDSEGQLKYVAYLIDGDRNNLTYSSYNHSVGETRVAVNDTLGTVNPPLEFNVSMKLEGLSEGNHHVDVAAEGLVKYNESDVSVGSGTIDTIYFIVTEGSSAPTTPTPSSTLTPTPTPSQEPTPIADSYIATLVIASVSAAAVVVTGLLVYFKKRKH
jgi:hypothetical protein